MWTSLLRYNRYEWKVREEILQYNVNMNHCNMNLHSLKRISNVFCIFTTDFWSALVESTFDIFIVIRIMFTYVMPCCFSSSLRSVINVGSRSLKTFSLSSTCSITRIMSAWVFGVLTLKVSPTAIVSPPTLQFARILWYTLRYLPSKNRDVSVCLLNLVFTLKQSFYANLQLTRNI